MDKDKIKMMFRLMEYDYLTDGQHRLIIKFEDRLDRRGYLTEPECDTIEDIFNRAAESVEWSR